MGRRASRCAELPGAQDRVGILGGQGTHESRSAEPLRESLQTAAAKERAKCRYESAVVGYGRCRREPPATVEPSKYRLYIGVQPGCRCVGIGSALHEHMVRELLTRGAQALRVRVRSDQSETIGFLTRRGFREYGRKLHFALDLAHPDTEALAETAGQTADRMAAAGVSIGNLVDYSRREPDWLQRLLAVYNKLGQDVPETDPYQPVTLDGFNRFLADPDLPHRGFFVATAGAECIGYSCLLGTRAQGEVIVGMTGVLQQYRRRGIATALKIQGIRYALATRFKVMVTSTSSVNVASIAVNERLGFRQTHTEIRLEKPIGSVKV